MTYSKIGTELAVELDSNQSDPPMTITLADGSFMVAWLTQPGGGSTNVNVRHYDASGTAIGDRAVVYTSPSGTALDSLVATALVDGGYALGWRGWTSDDNWIESAVFGADDSPVAMGIRVNAGAIPGSESLPVMTAVGNGFAVGWMSFQDDTALKDPVFRIFGANGTALTGEILASEVAGTNQYSISLAQTGDGNIVVTWHEGRDDVDPIDGSAMGVGEIQARVFNAGGGAVTGEFEVNAQSYGTQSDPSVTALAGGGFVVAWGSMNDHYLGYGADGVRLQVYANPGSHHGEIFIPEASYFSKPTVTALTDGNFVVTWMNPDSVGNAPLMLQVYDPEGNRIGMPIEVDDAVSSIIKAPSITALADGRFVVSWWDYGAVKAQVFGQAGDAPVVGSVSLDGIEDQSVIITAAQLLANTTDADTDPSGLSVTELRLAVGGGTLVEHGNGTWTYVPARDYAGQVDFSFSVSDGETTVHSTAILNIDARNDKPSTILMSGGSVLENSRSGTHVATFYGSDVDGEALTYALRSNGGGRYALNGQKLVVANAGLLDYEQRISDTVVVRAMDGHGAYVDRAFTIKLRDVLSENVIGSSSNNVLVGGAGSDKFNGGAGYDSLSGGGGKDYLNGGTGNDNLRGGAGNDYFVFDTKLDAKKNIDKIADFVVKDDTIQLDNLYFKTVGKGTASKPGRLDKDMFVIGSKAKDAEDRIIYDNKKGYLYYDPDGTGSAKAVLFATVSKDLPMTAADFLVI